MEQTDSAKNVDFNTSTKVMDAKKALGIACEQLNIGAKNAWKELDLNELKLADVPVSYWTPLAVKSTHIFHRLTAEFNDDELRAFDFFGTLKKYKIVAEWLPEWAELAGPTVARVGIPPGNTESGQVAKNLMLYCPDFARIVMASKSNWDEVFLTDTSDLLQSNRSLNCWFSDVLSRVFVDITTETVARRSWLDQARQRAIWAWPEIMNKAEDDGLLAHLAKSPRLGVWALRLALAGNHKRFERAMSQAPDLSWITPEESRFFFAKMGQAYYPQTLSISMGDYGKAVWRKAQAVDDTCKGEVWRALCDAGLPPGASPQPSEFISDSWHRPLETSLSMTEIEGARGGLLGQDAALLWGGMELELPEARRAFYGGSPLRWAFAQGLDVKEWSSALIQKLTAAPPVNARVDALLVELGRAGVKLGGPEDVKLSRSNRGSSEPLHLTLIKAGARAEGMSAAACMGVNIFEKDREKRPPLEALYELDRVKDQDQRLAAYLAAAAVYKKGGAALMLGQLGLTGAGPMHWAARGLCAASIAHLAQCGLSPMVSDAAGKTAGHWAARRYGVKFAAKIAPTLEALGQAGQDWAALDIKGVSALAELARRGPIEPLLPIVERAPDSVFAKERTAPSAMDVLVGRAARGEPEGLSMVEATTLTGTIGAGKEQPPATRSKRL